MRAFIAIELPSELKEKIDNVISELEDADFCDAKWVSEEKLHLTCKFLGEINKEQAETVKSVLADISKHQNSFNLPLGGIGQFNERILWVGGNSKDCIKLAGEIDTELSKLGFAKEEREFSIHLTLARIRYIKDKIKFQQILKKYASKDFGSFKVDKIKLMESILSAEGPIYRELASFDLI